MDKLDEVSNEAHDEESDGNGSADCGVFCKWKEMKRSARLGVNKRDCLQFRNRKKAMQTFLVRLRAPVHELRSYWRVSESLAANIRY